MVRNKMQGNELNNDKQDEKFWIQERRWLRHWPISPVVAN